VYSLLLNSSSRGKLARSVGKCVAVEIWVTQRWVTSWWSEGQSRALQVGRGQRMSLLQCARAQRLYCKCRERAREISNVLMMLTGTEQSVLLMMVAGMTYLLLCAHMVPQPHTNFQW
jgi:transposase